MEVSAQPMIILNSYSSSNDLPCIRIVHGFLSVENCTHHHRQLLMDVVFVIIFYLKNARKYDNSIRALWHQHLGLKAMGQYNARVQMESRALSTCLPENDWNVCNNQLKLFVFHSGNRFMTYHTISTR